VCQRKKPGVPLLNYIFLGAVLSSVQENRDETTHSGGADSTGGSDGDF